MTNSVHPDMTRRCLRAWAWLPSAMLSCSLLLTACGSGQNQDSIRIGSGQDSSTAGTDVSTDYPVFYVKRSVPDLTKTARGQDGDDDMRHLRVFSRTNADLYMRDRASSSAAEHNITARVRTASDELWDVKDLDVAADGKKVIFAMRGPLDPNNKDDEGPTWNIYEYDIAGDALRRVISSDVIAEGGQDVSPHYLPDGQILFSSTRQQASKAILIQTEGKPGFEAQEESSNGGNTESAFVLHIMNADGTNIQQVSFDQSHDFDASVMLDGRILFSRWDDAAGRTGGGAIHLYTMNPNGTGVRLLYGSASHATVADVDANGTTTYPTIQFVKSRQMPNGKILSLVRPFNGTEFGGDLYIIDTSNYVENTQAIAASAGMTGPAQTKSTTQSVRMVAAPSQGGRFAAATPLWDGTNRILVAWSQCRVIDSRDTSATPLACTSERLADTNFISAAPIYSMWMYDPTQNTYQPIVAPVEGMMISDVAIAQPRTAPVFLPYTLDADTTLDTSLKNENVGILDIRSVYDFDGTVYTGLNFLGGIAGVSDPASGNYANRPARFLRIEKAVSIPNNDVRNIDNNSFGASNFMREILGYIPVEPDGSVRIKVPSNVAFQISVVDTEGRRIGAFPRHSAWLSIRTGETVQCNGCHTPSTNLTAGQSGQSHGRAGSFNSVYAGATTSAFSGANSTFSASTGQTMAQARAAWSCTHEQCQSITPSVNLIYSEVWPQGNAPETVPAAVRAGDFKLSYTGSQGLTTTPPTSSSSCLTVWSSSCRVTINYVDHIQPIWERSLGYSNTVDGIFVSDLKCISCHNRKNPAGNDMVPAGQLELTSDASEDNTLRVNSYQELLFQDKALELNGGALQDQCIQSAIDPATNLPVCVAFGTVSPSLVARNARGSRFFSRFVSGGSHAGFLTEGELRLISEWVDIGAQYYNDPFKAPVN